jgi:sterol desaturase/sphingolipid hydroxylase (fatty acid hydroxylase superfamily)
MSRLYVSNKDESARLFRSNLLEVFTHVHWSVPLIVYMPVVGFLLWSTITDGVVGIVGGVLVFFAGVFIWTLTEYLLHRFVFHYEPTSGWGKRLHFLLHGVHHDYPNDSKRLVMPPVVSLPLAVLFYGLFYAVVGPPYLHVFFAGFLVGYLCYDTIHYATHHAKMKGRIGRWLKQYHILHHYQDNELGFGVSSPLWDFVFGTPNVPDKKTPSRVADR